MPIGDWLNSAANGILRGMSSLLSCSALRKSLGARTLFDNFSLTLSEGDRIGLIGPNGSGKTTLLEILAGNEPPDAGTVAARKLTRLAYVPQDSLFEPHETVRSVLTAALDGPSRNDPGQLRGAQPRSGQQRGGPSRSLSLDDDQKHTGLEIMLSRAGFEDADAPAVALSGGWKKRLAIAAALVTAPEVLLLDEPTNHLDLDGILWLERALLQANACLVVTHDRYFLENVATRVAEINRAYPQGAFQVRGNYSEFLERRQEFFEAQSKQQEALAGKVRREVEWLRRGPKARTSKSRARIDEAGRLIDQLADATARSATATAQIDFTSSERKTKRLIEVEGITKAFGDNRLFENLSLTLSPGVRVGLVGSNGSGKTTLLKILQGEIEPDEGTIRRADALRVVHFSQDRTAHFDPETTLRRMLSPAGDSLIYRDRAIHVAGWAKRFLFREEQLEMPMSRLSGGEKARVLIARLMLETADVLFLDEPTNDLDIPTLEVLEESLLEFPGALVLVSHDRYLLDRVSTVVIGLAGGGEARGRGEAGLFADYSQWEASRNARPEIKSSPETRFGPETRSGESGPDENALPASAAGQRKKLSYLEQREWDSMERQILESERELARWEREVQNAASDAERLPEAYAKLRDAHTRVEELYARWAELEGKVAG
jgi:ATP-binding cassette subfamily F protein uup